MNPFIFFNVRFVMLRYIQVELNNNTMLYTKRTVCYRSRIPYLLWDNMVYPDSNDAKKQQNKTKNKTYTL